VGERLPLGDLGKRFRERTIPEANTVFSVTLSVTSFEAKLANGA